MLTASDLNPMTPMQVQRIQAVLDLHYASSYTSFVRLEDVPGVSVQAWQGGDVVLRLEQYTYVRTAQLPVELGVDAAQGSRRDGWLFTSPAHELAYVLESACSASYLEMWYARMEALREYVNARSHSISIRLTPQPSGKVSRIALLPLHDLTRERVVYYRILPRGGAL